MALGSEGRWRGPLQRSHGSGGFRPPTADVYSSFPRHCAAAWWLGGLGCLLNMQIELFNTDRYGPLAMPWRRRLRSRGLPSLHAWVQNEDIFVGELCAMQDEAHAEGCPDAFDHLLDDLGRASLPVKYLTGLMPAWRARHNTLTAARYSQYRMLCQVKGKLDSESEPRLEAPLMINSEPLTPNKLAAPINFDDLSQGGALVPHLSGKIGEDSVEGVLKRLGIDYHSQFVAPFIGWGKSKQSRVDFKVAAFDGEPLDRGFYLEVKWRNRSRSADDDLTALLHNIESWYDLPTIVLYDGEGAVRDAYETVRHQMEQKRRKLTEKLLAVMTFNEFVLFAQTQLGSQGREAA